MPNHVHMMVSIDGREAKATLGAFVGYVKTRATKIAKSRTISPVDWQRGYYDHIVRGEDDHALTWKYIDENPAKWVDDEYFASE